MPSESDNLTGVLFRYPLTAPTFPADELKDHVISDQEDDEQLTYSVGPTQPSTPVKGDRWAQMPLA